jgi:hypothetical protein
MIKLRQLFILVTEQARLNIEQQQIPRIEAWLDALQINERADEQASADQQHKRERHLRDD